MAMRADRFIQDQNLTFQVDGGPAKGKGNASSQAPKKGLGGRKALNDISNSGKPAALQPSRKHNSANVITISEDLGISKTKHSVAGKKSISNAPAKAQVSGRKALSDLTNSSKPSAQALKRSQSKKLFAVAEEPPADIAGEGFLHDHQNCIKAQNAVDTDYFLKSVGLRDDICIQLASPRSRPPLPKNSKLETPMKELIMEEISEPKIPDQLSRSEFPSAYKISTVSGSPMWRSLYTKPMEYDSPKFSLKESP